VPARKPPQLHLSAPADWRVVHRAGFGPFTTLVDYLLPDGRLRRWTSRRQRKADLVAAENGFRRIPTRTWAIASWFSIGASLFALGSWEPWISAVSGRTDANTYFIGSLFFTAAAYLSFTEVTGTPESLEAGTRRHVRLLAWRPHRIDWWAAGIQLIGTVAFNLSTWDSRLAPQLSTARANELVWAPDVFGSVCFLVSSYLSWAEVCHSAGRLRLRDISWWIVAINLVGSVLFGISAIGAFYVRRGVEWNQSLVNTTTLWGAFCFLVAAVMLVPESRRGVEATQPAPGQSSSSSAR